MRTGILHSGIFAVAATVAVLAAGAACAEVLHYTANLDGRSETPPNDSQGVGLASVNFDTGSKKLDWTVDYSGLTGPATMAHFHGPAPVGKAAPVVIAFKGDLASPLKGSATLTDAQIADLRSGVWYVNVHTAAHPGGEIRGQVEPAK
jgi:hypothetical protein